jgi:hypothetical protein
MMHRKLRGRGVGNAADREPENARGAERAETSALLRPCRRCGGQTFRRDDELTDPIDPTITTGVQTCLDCGAQAIYRRTEEPMAKRGSKDLKVSRTITAPKPQDLPGMSHRAIAPLEEAAEAYVELRDQRMALLEQEVSYKAVVLKLMHKYGKTTYKRNGLEIIVMPAAEGVRVKKLKADDDDEGNGGEPLTESVDVVETDDDEDPEDEAAPMGDQQVPS